MPDRVIVAAITDLMLQSRVSERAKALAAEFAVADTDGAVRDAVAFGSRAMLVVVDLHAMGLDWRAAVAAAKEQGLPVLAFGRHTEPALLREARDAGCDRVVARSTLVEEFEALVEELVEDLPRARRG